MTNQAASSFSGVVLYTETLAPYRFTAGLPSFGSSEISHRKLAPLLTESW